MPGEGGVDLRHDVEGTLMASEPNAPRSRRALLTAAAGGAAAVAASAAMPLTTLAADGDNVVLGAQNVSETETTITTTSADPVNAPQVAFKAYTVNADAAGVIGSTGDETNIGTEFTAFTGVYGWSPTAGSPDGFGTGVWGDSEDVGVYGSGVLGVWGDANIGVRGSGGIGGVGVQALGASDTELALQVSGKVRFSRSGRATIGAGKSSVKVTRAGMTSSSRVFAVLHSNRAGRYVRAVVPTTGSFTVYLNTTVTSSTYVAWFAID